MITAKEFAKRIYNAFKTKPIHLKLTIYPTGYYTISSPCSITLCKNGEIVFKNVILHSIGRTISYVNPKFQVKC